MSDGQKAFPVSWDQFHRDARALAWRLNAAGPFTAMVTVRERRDATLEGMIEPGFIAG